jgi:uncharacterized membrane protein
MISIPLIFKRIKPSFFYGFRTKKMLNNKEIWYKTSQFLGILLYITAIIMTIGSMVLYYFLNIINKIFFQYIFFVIFFVPLFLSFIISYIYQLLLKPTSLKKE